MAKDKMQRKEERRDLKGRGCVLRAECHSLSFMSQKNSYEDIHCVSQNGTDINHLNQDLFLLSCLQGY